MREEGGGIAFERMKKGDDETVIVGEVNRFAERMSKAKGIGGKKQVAFDGVFELGPAAEKFMVLLMCLTSAEGLVIEVKLRQFTVSLSGLNGERAVGCGESLYEACKGALEFFKVQ